MNNSDVYYESGYDAGYRQGFEDGCDEILKDWHNHDQEQLKERTYQGVFVLSVHTTKHGTLILCCAQSVELCEKYYQWWLHQNGLNSEDCSCTVTNSIFVTVEGKADLAI